MVRFRTKVKEVFLNERFTFSISIEVNVGKSKIKWVDQGKCESMKEQVILEVISRVNCNSYV